MPTTYRSQDAGATELVRPAAEEGVAIVMPERKVDRGAYFGRAGHCFDIDGNLWHEPGACRGAPDNCSGKCCGYEEASKE
jgi:hypothetical protein